MSMFGGIEIDDIPESIVRDKYLCQLTEVREYDLTKSDWDIKLKKTVKILDFTVIQEDSDFVGESASVFVNGYTSSEIGQDPKTRKILFNGEILPTDLQQEIRKAIQFFKKFSKNLGFSEAEVSSGTVNFEDMKGHNFYVTMYPNKESKKTQISQNDPITPAEPSDSTLDDLDDI